jgi:hypothetical protein
MALKCIEAVLQAPVQFCYFVFFLFFLLLHIIKAITILDLDEDFYINESKAQDILLTQDQVLISDTGKKLPCVSTDQIV